MKRFLTALVLVPLIVYVVLWGPLYAFLAVLSTIALFCYHEYSGIVAGYGIDKPGPLGYAAGLILLLMRNEPMPLVTLLALITLGMSLGASDLRRSLPRAASVFFGIVYVFGTWRTAIPLREHGPYWLLFALALNWVGDSAAYYVGRKLGRHKLAPRISPGKSWEGAIASVAASIVFAVVYLTRLIPSVEIWQAVLLGGIGNIAGQVGDLAESALKRGAGVKDSGNMLPGHGGWLDRVDGILFALPVICWLVLGLGL